MAKSQGTNFNATVYKVGNAQVQAYHNQIERVRDRTARQAGGHARAAHSGGTCTAPHKSRRGRKPPAIQRAAAVDAEGVRAAAGRWTAVDEFCSRAEL